MNIAFMKIEPTNTKRSGIILLPNMGMSLIYERGITLSLTNLAYPNYNQNNHYNQILIARQNSAFSVKVFKSWKNVKNDKGP